MKTCIVIPCYNEAGRLGTGQIQELLIDTDIHLLLVNDGSSDGTLQVLEEIRSGRPDRVEVLNLQANLGKGEAVRMGLLKAIRESYQIVGYIDADFATPAAEVRVLLRKIRGNETLKVVMGSRWAHLGATVVRNPARHYVGRVFATLAAMILHLQVYDTQCGAKVFRVTPTLHAALQARFISRWIFDVELLGRLLVGIGGTPGYTRGTFLEVPLSTWIDVQGSKIRLRDKLGVFHDMAKIAAYLRRIRRIRD